MQIPNGSNGGSSWRPRRPLGARRPSLPLTSERPPFKEATGNLGESEAIPGNERMPPASNSIATPVAGLSFQQGAHRVARSSPVFPFDEQNLQQHRAWIARMAAGDTQPMHALHEAFSPLLFGVARRILRDSEDVREVVQDAFVKAWRQAPSYHPERGEVYSWMVFITRNQAIDRLRRGKSRQALLTALQNEENDDRAAAAPDERFDRREFLDHTLAHLTAPQRQALELAFFTGCSQAEIATAMCTPVGNVKNHLRRGMLKLRQLVARHE